MTIVRESSCSLSCSFFVIYIWKNFVANSRRWIALTMMMKLFVVAATALLLAGDAAAFSPLEIASKKKISLSSSSTVGPGLNSKDGYSDKPLYKPKSTTPVADKQVNWFQKQTLPNVVLDPDYFLTWAVALLGPLIWWYHPCKSWSCAVNSVLIKDLYRIAHLTLHSISLAYAADGTPSLIGIFGGGFHVLFAALLWVQTSRVRCVFEKDGFEFYNIEGPGLDLEKGAKLVPKPNNYVSGTRNRWKYDKIINYGKNTLTILVENASVHSRLC